MTKLLSKSDLDFRLTKKDSSQKTVNVQESTENVKECKIAKGAKIKL